MIFINYRLLKYLLSAGIALAFISCGTTPPLEYSNANIYNKTKHLKKPVSLESDSARAAFYVSGSYSKNFENAYYRHERPSFGEISTHFAHSGDIFSGAYGISFFRGSYNVERALDYQGLKNFWGYAFTSEFATGNNYKIEYIDATIRYNPVGLRFSILDEHGEYKEFRQKAQEEGLIDEFLNTGSSLTMGLFADFHIIFDDNHSLGAHYSFNFSRPYTIVTYSINFELKRFVFSFQNSSYANGTQTTFNLGYKLFDSFKVKK